MHLDGETLEENIPDSAASGLWARVTYTLSLIRRFSAPADEPCLRDTRAYFSAHMFSLPW